MNKKKYLIFSFILISSFFVQQKTHAYTIASSTPNEGNYYGSLVSQIAQTFVAQNDGLTESFETYSAEDPVNSTKYVELYETSDPNNLGTLLASSTTGTLRNDNKGTFSNPVQLTAGHTYTLIIKTTNGTFNPTKVSVNNYYSGIGTPYVWNGSTFVSAYNVFTLRSWLFILYGTSPTYTAPTLYITYPQDILAGDFSHWQTTLYAPNNFNGRITATYGNNTDYSGTITLDDDETKLIRIKKNTAIPNGTSTVTFKLYDNANNLISTKSKTFQIIGNAPTYTGELNLLSSTTAEYIINNPYSRITSSTYPDIFKPFATTTINCEQYENTPFFSSGTIGAITCGFKATAFSVIDAIINPHEASLQYITESIDRFRTIFPFSVVFELSSITQNTVKNNTGSYTFNLPTPTGGSIPIFSSSTISNYIGTSTMETVLTIESYSIWILTALIILTTIL